MTQQKRIFLIAGEVSGDVLGGRLMAALEKARPGAWRFQGVGGERMAEQGLVSRFPMRELSLMGIAEVLPHLPRLLRRIGETAAVLKDDPPDAVITIDAPSFNMRVLKKLGAIGVPRIHYVAPQAWAWRPWRAKKLARDVDLTLMLLPFEPDFFRAYGANGAFVGHPVVEERPAQVDGAAFRASLGIAPEQKLLCVLPGSRSGEIRRHLPVLEAVIQKLRARFPDLAVALPTIANVADEVRAATAAWPQPFHLLEDRARRFDAYAASDAAVAASGTVTLELALAQLPSVVIYRTHPLTGAIVRLLARVKWASLVNLAQDREVFPEFLQARCQPEAIAGAASKLLRDDDANAAMRADLAETAQLFGGGDGPAPSERAARAVIDFLDDWPTR